MNIKSLKRFIIILVFVLGFFSLVMAMDNSNPFYTSKDLAERGILKVTYLIGHGKPIKTVAFSPNGELVASASEDGHVNVWDLETGKCLYSFESRNAAYIIAFSPDSRLIAVGGYESVVFWKLYKSDEPKFVEDDFVLISRENEVEAFATPIPRNLVVRAIKFISNSEVVIFRSRAEYSYLDDESITYPYLPIKIKWKDDYPDTKIAAHNSNGNIFVMLSRSGDGVIFDFKAFKYTTKFTYKPRFKNSCSSEDIDSVAISDGDRYLAVCSSDYHERERDRGMVDVSIWDLRAGNIVKKFKNEGKKITSILFDSESSSVIIGSGDNCIEMWNSETGLRDGCLVFDACISAKAISSKYLLIGFSDGRVAVYTKSNQLSWKSVFIFAGCQK